MTTTLTQSGTRTILSPTTVTVQGAAPRKCYLYLFTLNATAGDSFQGKWSSNSVINFYIMTDSDVAQFKNCGAPPSSTYLTVPMTGSYSLNWVAPRTETEDFVFENYATGSQSTDDVTVAITVYKIGALQSYSTMYTTVSIPSFATNTLTQSSIYYSTLPPPLLSPENSGTLLALVAVIIFAFVLVLLLTRRARTSKVPEPPKSVAQTADKPTGKLFCINCGAELPPNSKFCNKCGSAQS